MSGSGEAGGRRWDLLESLTRLVRHPRATLRSLAARITPYGVGVAVIVVAVLTVRWWSISRWSWQFDDWVYMERATSMGFGEFLFQNYNGHVMPGGFLVVWVTTALAPLSHAVAVWVTVVAAGAATLVWARALRELCGARLRTLVPLALVALTPLQIQGTIWWAAALQTVALMAALGGCVLFATRLGRRGARRDRIALLVTFAAGLLMWEKALLLLVPVAALLLFVVPAGPGRWRRLVREGAWLGAVAAGYAILFVLVTRQPSTAPTPTEFAPQPLGRVAGSFGELVGHLLAPSLLGGPWGTLPVEGDVRARPDVWAVALTTVVLVGLMALALVVRRSAWVPLAMVVTYGAVSWGLVVLSRLDLVEVTRVGYERYALDIFMVLCLALAMCLAPEAERRRSGVRRSAEAPPRPRLTPRGRRVVGGVVVVGLAASLLAANLSAVDRIGVSPARSWVDKVVAQGTSGEQVVLVDDLAPDDVLFPPFWGEHAWLSSMLKPLADVSFDEPGRRLRIVAPDGRFVSAALLPAIRAKRGPVRDCGYALAPGDTVQVPMSGDLYDFRWGLEVNAFSSSAGDVEVELADRSVPLRIEPGLNAPQAIVVGEVDEIRISWEADEGVICVTDVLLGPLTAAKG